MGRLLESIRGAGDEVDRFAARVRSSTTQIRDDMERTKASVFDGGKSIDEILESTTELSNGKLGLLRFQIEALARDGNAWAVSLLDMLNQVQEGTANAADVTHAFGDGVIVLDGRLQSLKDVLTDVLPGMGEVQNGIREKMERLKEDGVTLEELIGRLKNQHNQYALIFAQLMEGWKAGRITLQQLIAEAQKIQQALPGSESDALIQAALQLAQANRNGDFG